jgi:uncharacterized Zn finger protein (UPF0148 family)
MKNIKKEKIIQIVKENMAAFWTKVDDNIMIVEFDGSGIDDCAESIANDLLREDIETNKICPKCKGELKFETVEDLKKDYKYFCPKCDENFYEVETIDKKKPSTYIKYHVFTNNNDEWLDDYDQAMKLYKEWVREYGTARLYEEIRATGFLNPNDNDKVINENCLESFGEWPI